MDVRNKRKRAENWDSSDKLLLRQLIEEKIPYIENKNVYTNTTMIKRETWKEITNTFNKMTATPRDISQLQSQWRGMKMKAKASTFTYKQHMRAIEGGPPPKSAFQDDEKLIALNPHEFEENSNEFEENSNEFEENSNEFEENLNEFDSGFSSTLENVHQSKENSAPIASTSKDCFKRQIEKNDCHKIPLNECSNVLENQFEYVEFLEEEEELTDVPTTSPPWTSSSKNAKVNCKKDQMKQELFKLAMDTRKREKYLMQLEHDERIKTILMQRGEKQKTLEMERTEKLKILQMERRHREEKYRMAMKHLYPEEF